MKKVMIGCNFLADGCLFVLTSFLVSIIPGLLNHSLAMDRQTLIHFILLYAVLFFFIFTFSFFLFQERDSKYHLWIAKGQNYIFLFLYIFVVVFALFIASYQFVKSFNLIPFRTIILRGYDFLVSSGRKGWYSLFRTVFFYILYPIPIFIAVKRWERSKSIHFYLIFVSLFLLFMEGLYFLFHSSFDVDHILLGFYGAYLAHLMEKHSIFDLFYKKSRKSST